MAMQVPDLKFLWLAGYSWLEFSSNTDSFVVVFVSKKCSSDDAELLSGMWSSTSEAERSSVSSN
jgi:hypothetical protein